MDQGKSVEELLKKIERLERTIARLKVENERLKEKSYLDQSQIMYQRRQIDFLMEGQK